MTRTRFQQGLDDLRQKLLAMGGLAEQAIDRAIRAYQTRDISLCRKVLDGDDEINRAEQEIDELGLDLLAMQQPMASDLRFILAVIKIKADLERVGDQAVNIAQRVQDMASLPTVEVPVDILSMASIVSEMVRKSLEAFVKHDAALAQSVLEMDDVVDHMNREAFSSIEQTMENERAIVHQSLDVLLIARNLERIADHSTNIAEDVIFWVRGADVRHHSTQA